MFFYFVDFAVFDGSKEKISLFELIAIRIMVSFIVNY